MKYPILLLLLALVVMVSGCVQDWGMPAGRVSCEQAGFVINEIRYEVAGNVKSILVEANNTGRKDLTLYAVISYADGSVDTRDPEFNLGAGEDSVIFTIEGVRYGIGRVSLAASDCLDMMDYVDRKDIIGIENEKMSLDELDTPTFTYTGDKVCRDDGKPIIMMFSAAGNSHCEWIKDTYESVVRGYVKGGSIVAYHWETKSKDNKLTPATETRISEIENAFYTKYNPERTTPTFIFGCSFVRIGNGYEMQNDTKAEEDEFRDIINALIS